MCPTNNTLLSDDIVVCVSCLAVVLLLFAPLITHARHIAYTGLNPPVAGTQ